MPRRGQRPGSRAAGHPAATCRHASNRRRSSGRCGAWYPPRGRCVWPAAKHSDIYNIVADVKLSAVSWPRFVFFCAKSCSCQPSEMCPAPILISSMPVQGYHLSPPAGVAALACWARAADQHVRCKAIASPQLQAPDDSSCALCRGVRNGVHAVHCRRPAAAGCAGWPRPWRQVTICVELCA